MQFHVGNLVVIKDENTPPNHWPLERITAAHPSACDHLVRVVSQDSKLLLHQTYYKAHNATTTARD